MQENRYQNDNSTYIWFGDLSPNHPGSIFVDAIDFSFVIFHLVHINQVYEKQNMGQNGESESVDNIFMSYIY